MTDQEIYDILRRTQQAYSFHRYGRTQWLEIIIWLASLEFRAIQIEAILMSKMMRHAADFTDNELVTLADFQAYLKKYENRAPLSGDNIEKLITETYGEKVV